MCKFMLFISSAESEVKFKLLFLDSVAMVTLQHTVQYILSGEPIRNEDFQWAGYKRGEF